MPATTRSKRQYTNTNTATTSSTNKKFKPDPETPLDNNLEVVAAAAVKTKKETPCIKSKKIIFVYEETRSKTGAKKKIIQQEKENVKSPVSPTPVFAANVKTKKDTQSKTAAKKKLIRQKEDVVNSPSPAVKTKKEPRSKTVVKKEVIRQEDEDVHGPSLALFIEPILSEIFCYLPTEDLWSCRKVCSEWSIQIAVHLFVKNLATVRPLSNQNKLDPAGKLSTTMDQYTSLMEKSRRIPFSNYKLDNLRLRLTTFSEPTISNLFKVCGPYMKSLEVPILPFFKDMKTFVAELSQLAPNLETLHIYDFPEDAEVIPGASDDNNQMKSNACFLKLKMITCRCINQHHYDSENQIGWMTMNGWKVLFESSPNLKTVEIRRSAVSDVHLEIGMVHGLDGSGRTSSITRLSFCELRESLLQLLMEQGRSQGLQLQDFHVDKIYDEGSQSLQDFLNTQQKSLMNLEVGTIIGEMAFQGGIIRRPPNHIVALNKMERLKSITLQLVNNGIIFKTMNQRSPLDIPNLVKVNITDVKESQARKMSKNFQLISLKDLTVNFDHDCSPGLFHALGQMFPNIMKLTVICISPRQMDEVVKVWPNLLHFVLIVENCSKSKMDQMKRLGFAGMKQQLPAVENLKELETFSVAEVNDDSPGLFKHQLFFKIPKN